MPAAVEVPYAITHAAGASAGAPGIGSSLAGLGTAVKVLVLSHPVSVAVVGGALLGAGVYYTLTRKRGTDAVPATDPAAAAA